MNWIKTTEAKLVDNEYYIIWVTEEELWEEAFYERRRNIFIYEDVENFLGSYKPSEISHILLPEPPKE